MPTARRPSAPGSARPGARGARPRPAARPAARPARPDSRPATGLRATPRASTRASESGAAATVQRQRRFTGRMAILALVLAALVVSYASSMRAYLQQRTHIADVRAQIASSGADIARLERDKQRYTDDSYVADQARARFGWVLPGEIAYQVIGRDGKPLESTDRLADPSEVLPSKPTAWWQEQADSLHKADHPPTRPPTPAASIAPDGS